MDSKLKAWRKKKKLSQQAFAEGLQAFAREKYKNPEIKLCQRTVGYWEQGTLPRKQWLEALDAYTGGAIKAAAFVNA